MRSVSTPITIPINVCMSLSRSYSVNSFSERHLEFRRPAIETFFANGVDAKARGTNTVLRASGDERTTKVTEATEYYELV